MPHADSTTFVKHFVAAVNSGSVSERRALQHPDDVCGTPSFIEEIVGRQHKRPIPERCTWRITRAPEALPFDRYVTYVVRPTHRLQLDYHITPTRSVTLVVTLVRDASGWHEVVGCPTAEGLARVAEARRRADQRKLEIARRIDALPQAIRDSVLALHLNSRIVSAIHHYAAAEKADTTIAHQVTDSIIRRHRLVYKYEYPHNTAQLAEDHYIAIDTIDGVARGWYYGTTDDFDTGREGYLPGFFVEPMRDLRFAQGSIAFSITLNPDLLFTEPLPPTIRDPGVYPENHRRWRNVVPGGERTYSGTVRGDTISLVLQRGTRVFRRIR